MISSLKVLVSCAAVLVRHPGLWATALGQLRTLTPTRWWSTAPYLPIPSAAYLRFRLQTAYGGAGTAAIDPNDLIVYLQWCRSMGQLQQASHG